MAAKKAPTTSETEPRSMEGKKFYPPKLSTKGMGLIVPVCEEIADKFGREVPARVAQFYGTISSAKQGNTTMGEYLAFTGNHCGINLITGAMYRSSKLLAPPVAENVLAEILSSRDEGDPTPVTYGFFLSVAYEERRTANFTAFHWECEPVIEQANDPLAAIAALMGPPPALPYRA